jgi:hypothetical protein
MEKSKKVRKKWVLEGVSICNEFYEKYEGICFLRFKIWKCEIALLRYCTDWKATQRDFGKIDKSKLRMV